MGFVLFLVCLVLAVLGIALCFKINKLEGKNQYGGKENKLDVKFSVRGIPVLLVALIVFVMWISYTTVDSGTIGVVTRFGQANRALPPGATFYLALCGRRSSRIGPDVGGETR
jgi:hypothetical protein